MLLAWLLVLIVIIHFSGSDNKSYLPYFTISYELPQKKRNMIFIYFLVLLKQYFVDYLRSPQMKHKTGQHFMGPRFFYLINETLLFF